MPIVSVLMTVYNRRDYLAAAVQSVLASSFSDFELIISDDCSTDGSWEIAQQLAETDERIRIHQNVQNLRDYGNRMQAASLATGEYLKYVDSDDMIYSHGLEVMVQSMQQFPQAALALSHASPELPEPYPVLQSPEESYRRHFLGRGSFGCGPGGAIIRRAVFEELGGFRPEWGVLSDLEFWLRAAARYPMLLQQPALLWWRVHEGQEFRIGDAERVYLVRGFELAQQALADAQCPLSAAERETSVKRLQHHFIRKLLSIAIRRRQPAAAFSAWRASGLTLLQTASGIRRQQ